MRAAGVPRARASPAVDVSSSAQAKEIRDSLTARITACVIPSSVLTLEALKEIGVTDARAMLRASRKEQRRATLRGKLVPRLVDMLREGEFGFAALQTRDAVVTMLPSDEFQACVKAGEATANVEKDMSKCPHDLRDAHCLHGEAVISLVLRELKLCELKQTEGPPWVSDVLRLLKCKPGPKALMPWRQKKAGEDDSAVVHPTHEIMCAVYTLCILDYCQLPRERFRIDGKILSFWEKALRSVLTRGVEDAKGFECASRSQDLIPTIVAIYILEQSDYEPNPDDPIQASSADFLAAISCAFLDAFKEVYGDVQAEDDDA